MKNSIIVTGSSGLIGYEVCENLVERGYRVFGFDRPGMPHPPPDADNVPCDLTSDESVRQAIEHVVRAHGRNVASCVHLAAYYDFSGEDSPLYEKVTVQGTQRLLAGLKTLDQVGQFVFSSTMLVHQPCAPGQRIDEDWPMRPAWPYPASKIKTEQLIREQHGNIPCIMLRIAGVYDDHCHSIPLAQQIKRIYERQLISHVYPGDTSHGQTFAHLDDCVSSIVQTVEHRQALGPELPLLIGEEEVMSYEELQKALGQLIHGEDWETIQIPKALAKVGAWVQDKLPLGEEPFIKPWMIDLADDHYALDMTRARKYIQWEAKWSLRETLPKMVQFLKSDPKKFYEENNLELAKELEKREEEHAGT